MKNWDDLNEMLEQGVDDLVSTETGSGAIED